MPFIQLNNRTRLFQMVKITNTNPDNKLLKNNKSTLGPNSLLRKLYFQKPIFSLTPFILNTLQYFITEFLYI